MTIGWLIENKTTGRFQRRRGRTRELARTEKREMPMGEKEMEHSRKAGAKERKGRELVMVDKEG